MVKRYLFDELNKLDRTVGPCVRCKAISTALLRLILNKRVATKQEILDEIKEALRSAKYYSRKARNK